MKTFVILLGLIGLLATLGPPKPRDRPYVRPVARPAPAISRAERERQVHGTGYVWEGYDLLYLTPDGPRRATFSDYPYKPQTVTPCSQATYDAAKKKHE